MKRAVIIISLMALLMNPFDAYMQNINLMPIPKQIDFKTGKFAISNTFTIKNMEFNNERIQKALIRFKTRLSFRTAIILPGELWFNLDTAANPSFIISCKRKGELKLNENESYQLTITEKSIQLSAETDFGVMYGLETLLQLIHSDANGYFFPCVEINDAPRFAWRGLMLDVCRHFIPLDVIKRNIDGMAAVKMNVLHLHLSEDQGFRIECKTFPKLHLMGSYGYYFTHEQIKEIIAYAGDRGIRVVPEFDLPGHASSWFMGYPEFASGKDKPSIQKRFGVFNPTFNPAKKETYVFLGAFFKEMAQLFPDEYMHIGGDENNGKEWDANPYIQKFMKDKGLKNNHELQAYFNTELLKILTLNKKKMMGWDEIFQPTLPKNIVIHSWRGKQYMVDAAKQGYQSLLSNGYYIDLCQPASQHYLNDPLPENSGLTPEQQSLILGGEATMWAELVTWETVDSRIWPRTAAIAERFWSPSQINNVEDMYRRLNIISFQLEELGLAHKKNRDMMMRRLVGNDDIYSLRVFANAVEPVKNYQRHRCGIAYTTSIPMSRVVDISIPDAPDAVKFNIAMDNYLKNRNDSLKRMIFAQLVIWNENHKQLKTIISKTPALKEIEVQSQDIENLGKIGLEALFSFDANTAVTPEWKKTRLDEITAIKAKKFETEIAFIISIEKIIAALKEK